MPALLGVPSRQVVALCGDGSFNVGGCPLSHLPITKTRRVKPVEFQTAANIWDENRSGSEFCSLPLRVSLPVDVYGVAEGVAEGSNVGLGVGVPDGVGVGETSVPG